jgi:hypothetical protein
MRASVARRVAGLPSASKATRTLRAFRLSSSGSDDAQLDTPGTEMVGTEERAEATSALTSPSVTRSSGHSAGVPSGRWTGAPGEGPPHPEEVT